MKERLYVGQKVWVIDHGNTRTTPYEATIAKIGRKNVQISLWGRNRDFSMETHYMCGDRYGSGTSFYTEEGMRKREEEAKQAQLFRNVRLQVWGSRLTEEDKEAIYQLLLKRGYSNTVD